MALLLMRDAIVKGDLVALRDVMSMNLANSEVKDEHANGLPVLQFAIKCCCEKKHEETLSIIEVLLEYGAAPLQRAQTTGFTAAHAAVASQGDLAQKCLCLIIDADDGSVEARDSRGDTPLHLACRLEKSGCAKELLAAAASMKTLNLDQKTPKDLCPHATFLRSLESFSTPRASANKKNTSGIRGLLSSAGSRASVVSISDDDDDDSPVEARALVWTDDDDNEESVTRRKKSLLFRLGAALLIMGLLLKAHQQRTPLLRRLLPLTQSIPAENLEEKKSTQERYDICSTTTPVVVIAPPPPQRQEEEDDPGIIFFQEEEEIDAAPSSKRLLRTRVVLREVLKAAIIPVFATLVSHVAGGIVFGGRGLFFLLGRGGSLRRLLLAILKPGFPMM